MLLDFFTKNKKTAHRKGYNFNKKTFSDESTFEFINNVTLK